MVEDRIHLLAPATRDAIAHALGRLRVVTGCRSPEPPELDAAVAAVLALQSLCQHEGVMEVEVNPLIVTPTRAVAVDAMVTTA